MSVFISLETDAFQETFAQQKVGGSSRGRAGASSARRPLRGLEIKDDTYSIIKVVTSTGAEIPLVDSGSSSGFNKQYTNFILQSVNEARMEKHQIVETFGESYIFFFGESPRFLDVQAVLLNSNDFNWEAEFWENYNNYLRGTKSVEMGARTYLFYDDNIVEGYMLQAQCQKTSESPLTVSLAFRLYITNTSNISFVGDQNYPVRASIEMPNGISDVNVLTQDASDYAATVGLNLQQLGFGGGTTLSQALRDGADPSSLDPALRGILRNAEEAFGVTNGSARLLPIRSLISDNVDEYMGRPPTQANLNQMLLAQQTQEADNLAQQALQALRQITSLKITPTLTSDLGLSPSFYPAGVGVGYGYPQDTSYNAPVSGVASFGAPIGVNFRGQTVGGIGGGLGFAATASGSIGYGTSAGFLAGSGYASVEASVSPQLDVASFRDVLDQNFDAAFGVGSGAYQGGVLTAGISSGAGIGGGIRGGAAATVAFRSAPSRLPASSGGGSGASISVAGTTTAFAMVAIDGEISAGAGASAVASIFAGKSF